MKKLVRYFADKTGVTADIVREKQGDLETRALKLRTEIMQLKLDIEKIKDQKVERIYIRSNDHSRSSGSSRSSESGYLKSMVPALSLWC